MAANKPWMINGRVYAFNRGGSLHEKAGWVQFRTERVSPNGEYLGTLIRWAYTDQNGIAVTGWKKISGNWYYFDKIGYMVSDDWASDSLGTCWLDSNGRITKDKWIKYDGEWYYLKANGYRAEDEWTRDSVGWMFMDSDGRIQKNMWVHYNDALYYLKANGYMAANEYVTIDGKDYYFGKDGKMISG